MYPINPYMSTPSIKYPDVPTYGLLAYYHFNKSDGNIIHDSSQLGIDINSFVNYSEDGKNGDCLLYDNIHYYTRTELPAHLSVPVNCFSIGFWIFFNSIALGSRPISDWHQNVNKDRWLFYETSGNKMSFIVCTENESNIASIEFTPILNKWIHIIGTFNGANIKLYIDGILYDSKTLIGRLNSGDGVNNAYIGSQPGYKCLDGKLDEFVFYNRELSNDEIIAISE